MKAQPKKLAERTSKNDQLRDELFPMIDKFEKAKPAIVADLREIHQQGPSIQPFDEKGTLDALKFFSCSYAGWVIARKRTRPAPVSDVRERFHRLATDMKRVRRLLAELMGSREFSYVENAGQRIEAGEAHRHIAVVNSFRVLESVGEACKNPDIPERFSRLAGDMERVHRLLSELLDPHQFSYVWKRMEIDVFNEIIVATNSLAVVESALREACKNVPAGRRGRPHDRALGPGDVEHLAKLYAKSTGCEPGSGKGPFARFVSAVLLALGCNVSDDHVVDVIKAARLPKRKGRGNVA